MDSFQRSISPATNASARRSQIRIQHHRSRRALRFLASATLILNGSADVSSGREIPGLRVSEPGAVHRSLGADGTADDLVDDLTCPMVWLPGVEAIERGGQKDTGASMFSVWLPIESRCAVPGEAVRCGRGRANR